MMGKSLKDKYIHHRSLLVKGHGELSLVVSVFNYAMITWLLLRDLMTFSRYHIFWILPSLFVVVTVIQYVIGYFWEKKHLVDAENQWIADRTPMLKDILEQTKK